MKYIKTVGNYDIFEATEPDCEEGYKSGYSFFLAIHTYNMAKFSKCFDLLEAAETWCMEETWTEEEF